MRGLSLIELMVALLVLAIVTAVALPIYRGYSIRAERTGAQTDLVRCAQGMERHASIRLGYELAVDTDGDGVGDASTGVVSSNICVLGTGPYELTVHTADAGSFVLRAAAASATNLVADDGVLEIDSTGARRWDRNNDGDFDDQGENAWR